MTNILEAIYNIVNHKNYAIREFYSGRNRANSMGDALENYVKDAFANSFQIEDEKSRMEIHSKEFSWLGTQNNPPDIMIRGGDAIEVKKTQSANTKLALNSSYPKSDLRVTSPMITNDCKNCEDWKVKDLIYCVGHTSDKSLNSLWMVYGSIFAAKHEIYQRIKTAITSGINLIPDVVFSNTKELGRVNQVDPLGITNLRIRGMWHIENPRKVFDYLHKSQENKFELITIIPKSKFQSFPKESILKLQKITQKGFTIEDVKVKNPNNPAILIDCKLIKFQINE